MCLSITRLHPTHRIFKIYPISKNLIFNFHKKYFSLYIKIITTRILSMAECSIWGGTAETWVKYNFWKMQLLRFQFSSKEEDDSPGSVWVVESWYKQRRGTGQVFKAKEIQQMVRGACPCKQTGQGNTGTSAGTTLKRWGSPGWAPALRKKLGSETYTWGSDKNILHLQN